MLDFFALCKNLVERIHIPDEKSGFCKVAVVIPTYKNKGLILETVQKIKEQTLVPDIIVVDNNEDYETFNVLKAKHHDITIIKSRRNWGASGGQYLGGAYALCHGYEYIIFADDDAQPVDKDLIECLTKTANRDTVTVPKHVLVNNLMTTQSGLKIALFHYVCVHRNILMDVGLPDFDIFIKYDDNDLLIRISMKYEVVQVNKRYYHPVKPEVNITNDYYFLRNYMLLARRYREIHPLKNVFVTIFLYGVRSLVNMLLTKNVSIVKCSFFRAVRDALSGRYGRLSHECPRVIAGYPDQLEARNDLYLIELNEGTLKAFKEKFKPKGRTTIIKPQTKSLLKSLKTYLKIMKGLTKDRTLVLIEPTPPAAYVVTLLFKRVAYAHVDRKLTGGIYVVSERNRANLVINVVISAVLVTFVILPTALFASLAITVKSRKGSNTPSDPGNVCVVINNAQGDHG